MIHFFSSNSADELWLKVASAFRARHDVASRPSRAGPTQDIGRVVLELTDPRERWIVSRIPSINPAFALAEVIWILCGRNDSAFLNFFNRSLPKFAGDSSTYDGAYGYRLRRHFGVDQLTRAYQTLCNCDQSRQVVLQFWDVRSDFPAPDGTPSSPDVPCNVTSFLKIRDGDLDWMQVMRSNDLFRGLPYNIVQFTTLQEIMAGWLGVRLGSFTLVTDSMHVYEADTTAIDESRRITPPACNSDSLSLTKPETEAAITELARRVDQMVDGVLSVSELTFVATSSILPKPFSHILLMLVAEALRRLHQKEIAEEIVDGCDNPIFRQLWTNWSGRFEGKESQRI